MSTKSIPAVAIGTWHWRDVGAHKWIADAGDTAACRASVAAKRVTVWLPGGAMVYLRCRDGAREAFKREFRYTFGYTERRLITMRIVPMPGEFAPIESTNS